MKKTIEERYEWAGAGGATAIGAVVVGLILTIVPSLADTGLPDTTAAVVGSLILAVAGNVRRRRAGRRAKRKEGSGGGPAPTL